LNPRPPALWTVPDAPQAGVIAMLDHGPFLGYERPGKY
jgi:hypothetical protein